MINKKSAESKQIAIFFKENMCKIKAPKRRTGGFYTHKKYDPRTIEYAEDQKKIKEDILKIRKKKKDWVDSRKPKKDRKYAYGKKMATKVDNSGPKPKLKKRQTKKMVRVSKNPATILDDDQLFKIVNYAEIGLSDAEISRAIQINRQTFAHWKKTMIGFQDMIDAARTRPLAEVSKAFFDLARTGENPAATLAFLNVHSEKHREAKILASNPKSIDDDYNNMKNEELLVKIKAMRRQSDDILDVTDSVVERDKENKKDDK